MKNYLIICLFLIIGMSPSYGQVTGGAEVIPSYIRLLSVVTAQESGKLLELENKSRGLKEEMSFVKDVYKRTKNMLEFVNTTLDVYTMFEITLNTYEEYIATLQDISKSKIPLTSKEVANYINLMNVATFNTIYGEKVSINHVADGALTEFEKIYDIIKGSKSDKETTNIIQITKLMEETEKKIRECYRATKACRKYVQCAISKIEYEHGIYDMKKLQKKIDTKVEKYKNI